MYVFTPRFLTGPCSKKEGKFQVMYFATLNMHWLSEIKLKHCRYYSKQRKHQMREVNTKQHTKKKQPRKSNKFELLFIHVMMTGSLVLVLYPVLYDLNKFSYTLYGYFYTRPVCFYQILQAMPVKPRPLWSVRNIRTPQRFLAMNDTLILLHQVFSFQLCET